MERYNPKVIEQKWREKWEKERTFKVSLKDAKRPFYNLMMFPYPSGEGLHVGHVYAFGGADTYGRFKLHQGFQVFEPMGFDSFGIHSENFAIKINTHPKELIERTTKYFREEQLKRMGAIYDWDHQVITSEPSYYKWTQWLFTELFKAGLAVREKAPVDWCPSCKTVLANEQVIAGKCERCSSQVIQKELEQWFFKITSYAERLLQSLEKADWSESTKLMQRNWIGKSTGAEIYFPLKDSEQNISVYTTRADTIFGATFLVLAPEHQILTAELKSKNPNLNEYVEKAKNKSEIERSQEKTGIFSGLYAINPVTKKEIPVWVADYVLTGYGTGAIMAVPAHDQRDYEFAKKFELPIVPVVSGGDIGKEAFIGAGKLINSGQFDGLASEQAIRKITNYIEENQLGKATTHYHLRDWLISRQRYWGPPIPMIYCENCAEEGNSWFKTKEAEGRILDKDKLKGLQEHMKGWYPVAEKDLPVELPFIKDYQPKGTGVSPLASVAEFSKVACPSCGKQAERETDVSDTFLDSSWYFLRYPTAAENDSEKIAFDRDLTKKWLPVDMYIGGNEHAVLHLLYSRFITMVLHDLGLIDFEQPYKKFRALGLIIKGGAKMSKSRGNVVNPNEYMDAYGADTLRTYLLFIGPFDQGGDFSDKAIVGVYRFLNRLWDFVQEIKQKDDHTSKGQDKSAKEIVAKKLNQTIKKVGEDLENLRFNTAIASLMELLNLFIKEKSVISKEEVKSFLILLSPFAPFVTEELWFVLGGDGSVNKQPWPDFSEKSLVEESVSIPVQVDGKIRGLIEALRDEKEEKLLQKAKEQVQIAKYFADRKISKAVYVPGKILSIVTS